MSPRKGAKRGRTSRAKPAKPAARARSRATSSGRAAAARPDPELEIWAELYGLVETYRVLAPWRWMTEAQLFGVRDPAGGEVGWCCVLGAGGDLAGLAVYKGDSGFDFQRRVQMQELEEDEALFGQEALVLAFADRGELSPEEHRRLKRLKLVYRGRGEWPRVESHAVGRLPVQPGAAELLRMVHTLKQATLVAAAASREPRHVEPDEHGKLLVIAPRETASGPVWSEERVDPPAPIAAPLPVLDLLRVERLRQSALRSGAVLECEVFPGPAVIHEKGGVPYAPAIFLLVDAVSQAVVHLELTRFDELARLAQAELLGALEALQSIPAELRARRPRVVRGLAPLMEALGGRCLAVEELPGIEEARASLKEFLSPG